MLKDESIKELRRLVNDHTGYSPSQKETEVFGAQLIRLVENLSKPPEVPDCAEDELTE